MSERDQPFDPCDIALATSRDDIRSLYERHVPMSLDPEVRIVAVLLAGHRRASVARVQWDISEGWSSVSFASAKMDKLRQSVLDLLEGCSDEFFTRSYEAALGTAVQKGQRVALYYAATLLAQFDDKDISFYAEMVMMHLGTALDLPCTIDALTARTRAVAS